MRLIILGLILGLLCGYFLPFQLPVSWSKYISVALLAGLDSVVGGARAGVENKFDFGVFGSGFLMNLLLAAGFTFTGDILGADLYMAAVITFGMRVFINCSGIRRALLGRKNEGSVLDSVVDAGSAGSGSSVKTVPGAAKSASI